MPPLAKCAARSFCNFSMGVVEGCEHKRMKFVIYLVGGRVFRNVSTMADKISLVAMRQETEDSREDSGSSSNLMKSKEIWETAST